MRRRLVISTIAIVLVVLGSLAVPVGLIIYNAGERQLETDLETKLDLIMDSVRAANAGGVTLDFATFVQSLGDGVQMIVESNDAEVFSTTPNRSSTVSISNTAGQTTVTLFTNISPLDGTLRDQLSVLIYLAIGAVLAAAGLAAVQAHQLARPLERLSARASRIGDGDFSRMPFIPTHIPEIDRIGTSLDTSAERVETMLANERHFTADATHQLRTGITGIAMRFEILSMRPDPDVQTEAQAGLAQTDQMNATIDELLAATRNRSTQERQPFDLTALVNDHAAEWQPRFATARRHISVITAAPAPIVFGTKGLAGQVVDILVDNALKHGEGAVTLMIDGPSVVVIDQGRGMTPDKMRTVFDGPVDPSAKHGRGLALARRLAQVDGATLDVVGNQPLRIRYRLNRADPED